MAYQNFFDTPDGRLLVATLNKAQLDAVQHLIVAAFERGLKEGVAAARKVVEDFVEEVQREDNQNNG